MPTVLVERLSQTWIPSKFFCFYVSIVQSLSHQDTKILFSPSSDKLMWLHTTVAFLYLLLTVHTMRKHNSRMHYQKDDLVRGCAHLPCAQKSTLMSRPLTFIQFAGEVHAICQWNVQKCRWVGNKTTLWVSHILCVNVKLCMKSTKSLVSIRQIVSFYSTFETVSLLLRLRARFRYLPQI